MSVITAREIGRKLELTVGGREPGMSEVEAVEADATAVRITIPPLSAADGSRLFSAYTGILFNRAGDEAERKQVAFDMTRLALGAEVHDFDTDEQRAAADAQWDLVQSLRWAEGEPVCQAALFWQIQGGGIDLVDAILASEMGSDGQTPKAQEVLLRRAGLWTPYSRLRMLLSGESENPTQSPADTADTGTPAGTSKSEPEHDSDVSRAALRALSRPQQ